MELNNMTNPMIRIHNTETNEVIDREMTESEFAQYEADQIAKTESETQAQAKATARAAILDRLGLTAEEAALLLS
jgi:hypothetical protein